MRILYCLWHAVFAILESTAVATLQDRMSLGVAAITLGGVDVDRVPAAVRHRWWWGEAAAEGVGSVRAAGGRIEIRVKIETETAASRRRGEGTFIVVDCALGHGG